MYPLEHNAEISFAGANKKVLSYYIIFCSVKWNILQVYVFMSSEPSSDVFPSELTSKYTVSYISLVIPSTQVINQFFNYRDMSSQSQLQVSKVLGKGACGEVRLGFRIPDLHRCSYILGFQVAVAIAYHQLPGWPSRSSARRQLPQHSTEESSKHPHYYA